MIYGTSTKGHDVGTILTRKEVVDSMLDIVDYVPSKDLSKLKILDPAGGEGVFILQCIERLSKSAEKFDFNFDEAYKNLLIVEIDTRKVKIIENNLRKKLEVAGRLKETKNPYQIIRNGDFLVTPYDKFDIIVGNPPYVRQENIPSKKKEKYRKIFPAFYQRSDIYVAFFEKGLKTLSDEGSLCYICSNRWMKNTYGKKLRELISSNYDIPLIINLENAKAFEEDVMAYASITLIESKKANGMVDYFETDDIRDLDDIFKITFKNKKENGKIKHLVFSQPKGSERISGEDFTDFSKLYSKIEEQGFKIRIGVATGRDSVFIGKDMKKKVESELLLPIVKSRDLKNGKIEWGGNFIFNPFNGDSNALIKLSKYPKTKKYLMKHKTDLEKRHVAKNDPDRWYKTIDRIYPKLLKEPKLLFTDISKNKLISLDRGEYYPHHNLYYITGRSIDELKILGSFMMSDSTRKQLNHISNLMRGGIARWQCQNLRKLRVPKLSGLSKKQKEALVEAFDKKDIARINRIVSKII